MKVIILCGGSGSRLWPLSRTQYPKQFLKLEGMEHSIFQLTLNRALMLCGIEDIYFVTSEQYKHLIQGQMEELGITPHARNILCEPTPKNTLPAIVFAVRNIETEDLAVVFSSDHVIDNEKLLIKTINSANGLAKEHIIVFGIKPLSPETAYGYIRPGKEIDPGYEVAAFVEKPDIKTAEQYVLQGYLWNSGMFMFNTQFFLSELEKLNPEVYDAFSLDSFEDAFAKTPNISIDYGFLERCSKNVVLPMHVGWNDLGNFVAFYDKYDANLSGNVSFNNEIILDGTRNLVYSNGDKAIALIGVSDTVVIDQKDALLVCGRKSTGKVREVVDILKERGDKRADSHLTEFRFWGSFTALEDGENYNVKRLTLSPGKKSNRQMHYHRNEHWIVVRGTAEAEIDGVKKILRCGESICVQAGQIHRLANPGRILLEVIEVQSGAYLEYDDVVKYPDENTEVK